MAEARVGAPSALAASHAYYTLSGDPAGEACVVQDLSRLATGVDSELGDALRGLVLTGPFARAEGGIVYDKGEPHAADPGYELLALFKSKPERRQHALSMIGATWTRLLGTRVAIRALDLHGLSQAPPTPFWFHAGRRQLVTLAGDPALVGTIPCHEPGDLPAHEAVFTLCEHLAALALATLAGAPEPGLVDRMQRAVLACGDALLLWRGQYADVLKARAEGIETVCTSAALRAGYADAIVWSARPDAWAPSSCDAATWLASTRRWLSTWYLDFEAERAGTARDLLAYVRHPAPLSAERDPRERRAPSLAARLIGRRLPALAAALAQPMERLLRCSVALAFAPHVPAARLRAAQLLRIAPRYAAPPSDAALEAALQTLASSALDDRLGHPFAGWSLSPSRPRF